MDRQPEREVRYLARLLDIAHDAIMVMDSNAVITFWNGGAERLYGWSKQEAAGRRSHELLVTQFPRELAEIEAELRQTGEWNGELIHSKKDGSTIIVSSRWVLMRDESGAETGFLELNRDITETKRLQDRLGQAQRMEAIGRLAGGVAHDFNNLLTVIIGYAASLRTRLEAGSSLRPTVEEIERAAAQAALVTGQLLAFSRRQVTRFEVLDLNKLVGDMRPIVGRLIGEDIDLDMSLDESSPRVKADAGQLTQVLMNLAANARDAMPNGGKLTIETQLTVRDGESIGTHDERPSGRYALLSVTDNGQGMDRATRTQIFEPFFTTKEIGRGTGLGLATTYGIVREHGGWIDVYSEPGHGTRFGVYLPAIAEQVQTVPPAVGVTGPRRTGTILLVEDQAAIRMLAEDVLEEAGHHVLAAGDGLSALKLAEKEPEIDMVVTDVVMPKMSGPELVEHLLRDRPKLIVLYTSGYTGHALFRTGTLESGTAFLNKPFTPEGLLAKVDELFSGAHSDTAHAG